MIFCVEKFQYEKVILSHPLPTKKGVSKGAFFVSINVELYGSINTTNQTDKRRKI